MIFFLAESLPAGLVSPAAGCGCGPGAGRMGPPRRLHVLPQLLQSPVRPEDGELSSHLPSKSCAVLFRGKRLEGRVYFFGGNSLGFEPPFVMDL